MNFQEAHIGTIERIVEVTRSVKALHGELPDDSDYAHYGFLLGVGLALAEPAYARSLTRDFRSSEMLIAAQLRDFPIDEAAT